MATITAGESRLGSGVTDRDRRFSFFDDNCDKPREIAVATGDLDLDLGRSTFLNIIPSSGVASLETSLSSGSHNLLVCPRPNNLGPNPSSSNFFNLAEALAVAAVPPPLLLLLAFLSDSAAGGASLSGAGLDFCSGLMVLLFY